MYINLYEVKEFIEQIQAESSRTGKEEILKSNSENNQLKHVLKFVYDPFILTGVSMKHIDKIKASYKPIEADVFLQSTHDTMEFISLHNTGTQSAIESVIRFGESMNDDLKPLFYQIITKELKTGVSASTLNKVFGKGFINKFDVMLAKSYEKYQHKIQGEKIVITEKLDGQRVVAINDEKGIKFLTRQGKILDSLVDIEKEIAILPYGVYDGELLIQDHERFRDRAVLQETLKLSRKNGEKKGLTFHLFDYVSLEEFKEGKSSDNFIKRKEFLMSLIESAKLDEKLVTYVPNLYVGTDQSVIAGILKRMEDEGKEGLMLNRDKPYVTKRSDHILKIKTMLNADLNVTGYEEGTGKYKGKLGALILDYKGNELRCGTGFTDEQRMSLWEYKDTLPGRVVEINYFRESENDKGGKSVSFPVFVRFREEGKEVSYH